MIFSRIIPLLLVVGAVGLFIGYTQPTYGSSVAYIKEDIPSVDTAHLAAEHFKQKEVQLTQQRAALSQEQLARLEAFLPDSVDNVQLIVDLNSLAARSGVQLSQFDIAEGGSASDTASSATTAGMPQDGGPGMGAAPLTPGNTALALRSSEPTVPYVPRGRRAEPAAARRDRALRAGLGDRRLYVRRDLPPLLAPLTAYLWRFQRKNPSPSQPLSSCSASSRTSCGCVRSR